MRPVETKQGDPETYQIIGAAMEVHKTLGCGFLEKVYQAALPIELALSGVTFREQVKFRIMYKDQQLKSSYHADLVCFESVIVEVKAVSALGPIDEAQAINYLRASGLRKALLLNFGARSLQYWRRVL